MLNLDLLERIARGERSFVGDAAASDPSVFDELMEDARRLAEAGYIGSLQTTKKRMHEGSDWLQLIVSPPGVTPAGIEALRSAGRDVPGFQGSE